MLRSRFFLKCSVPCLKLNLIGFFNRMVSNTQKNSQLFLKKFFSQGFICRQENATAVLAGILDFDSFLITAALLTHLIFSVGRGEKSSKSNQNRKRSSLESSFRSELLFRDHSRSTRQFALVKQERFYLTKVFNEKVIESLQNKTINKLRKYLTRALSLKYSAHVTEHKCLQVVFLANSILHCTNIVSIKRGEFMCLITTKYYFLSTEMMLFASGKRYQHS